MCVFKKSFCLLQISDNLLVELPDFANFPLLQYLYVHGNAAVTEVVGINTLTHLRCVKLDLDMLPDTLTSKG